jgi:hypothetical protein
MAEPKTKPTEQSVTDFLATIEDDQKRRDCFAILEMMREVTQCDPKMWGPTIVGFGAYHYRYESGREGEWPLTGFSPRKQNLTLYLMGDYEKHDDLMQKLGKHSIGKSCLYIKRLADVDLATLRELVQRSVDHTRQTHA